MSNATPLSVKDAFEAYMKTMPGYDIGIEAFGTDHLLDDLTERGASPQGFDYCTAGAMLKLRDLLNKALGEMPGVDLRLVVDQSTGELIDEVLTRIDNSNGLEFAQYVAIDLLQMKLNEELVKRDETPDDTCPHCVGTGEGPYDTSCSPCRGSGVAA